VSKGKRLATAHGKAQAEVMRLREELRKSHDFASTMQIRDRLFSAEQAMAKAKCLKLLAKVEGNTLKAKRAKLKAEYITAKFEAKYEVPLWD